jgi:hypothetical protein
MIVGIAGIDGQDVVSTGWLGGGLEGRTSESGHSSSRVRRSHRVGALAEKAIVEFDRGTFQNE